MAESEVLQVIVIGSDREAGYATVVLPDGVTTQVYPQDGALPEVGHWIRCVRNGGDLIPISSSQRSSGTFRGALEADSFLGLSETTADSWDDPWVWTPLANATVAQPTEGVDPDPWMRLTRINSTGRAQATITVPLPTARRYQAVELSAPAASTTGRDCYVRVDFQFLGAPISTTTYHLDNLYADPRRVQTPPLKPPAFATEMKLTVYSESTTLTVGQFLDVRVRAWTVPLFQGGALLDLDETVLADHRGLIVGGYPVNEADRTIPIVAGTGAGPVPSPSTANVVNFPTLSAQSTYRFKPLTGNDIRVKLTARCTGAAPASAVMWFKLPYVSRDHELFQAVYLDSGNAWHLGAAHVDAGTDQAFLLHNNPGANNGNTDEATPFAFGNNDLIIVSGVYERQS